MKTETAVVAVVAETETAPVVKERKAPVARDAFLTQYHITLAKDGTRKDVAEALDMTADSVSARVSQMKREYGIELEPLRSEQGRTATTPDEIRALIASIKEGLKADGLTSSQDDDSEGDDSEVTADSTDAETVEA